MKTKNKAKLQPILGGLHVLIMFAKDFSGCSVVLPQSKDKHFRLTSSSKLPIGVSVIVDGCSTLC